MNRIYTDPPSIARFKRNMLMVMIVLGWLSTAVAFVVMDARGVLTPTMRGIHEANLLILLAVFLAAWRCWLPQHAIELLCLVFAVVVCALCMALRLYWPRYGAGIDLQPLYMWIPVVYVLAFALTDHGTSLVVALGILALFVGISLPYLVHDIDAPYGNFTVQLHVVSAALIAALHFFSGYQHSLLLAQRKVDQLAHLSNTDELTKLANRRHMAALIDAELTRHAGHGGTFAVMLFDIDRFKAVNDQLGHGTGDAVLVALAARAVQAFRGTDVLGRWGGDEFVALVREVDADGAVRMAEALCRRVAAEPLGGCPVTVSCGATLAASGDSIDSLLQRADAALYAAKRAGRNRAEGMLPAS